MKKEMKLIFSDGKIHLALLVMLLCFNVYGLKYGTGILRIGNRLSNLRLAGFSLAELCC